MMSPPNASPHPQPPGRLASVARQPESDDGKQNRRPRQRPRDRVHAAGKADDRKRRASGTQRPELGKSVGPHPAGRVGRKPLERTLDQHTRIGDRQKERSAVSRHKRGVELQCRSAKQRRKRPAADDRARDSADQRSHSDEVPADGTHHGAGQMVCDVVLYRRGFQGGDRPIGKRPRL
jgi:hypothetical protein